MCNKEIVICAAIWVQDGKKRPYQPTNIPSGTVFCGLRHPSILSQLAAYDIAHKNRSVQGFLTSKNRFLTREEASELVRNNNQEMVVDRSAIREQLYSEELFKKAFDRASRGKDINSFEKQEKVDGLNFLYNPNNDRMRNGHIIIDGTGLFKQIMKSGT